MKLHESMRTASHDGELYVSVSDLEDALRAATGECDQATAHTLRVVASALRPAVVQSRRRCTTRRTLTGAC